MLLTLHAFYYFKGVNAVGDGHLTRRKSEYFLIISLTIIVSFCILFTLRSVDDNRLTSWQDVFSVVDGVLIFALLVPGLCLSYMLTRLSFYERYPALFLFLISFAVGTIFWREPELIVDSSRYFTQSKHLSLYGPAFFLREWGKEIPAWTDLPVVPFLYGLIFKFLGESRTYIQTCTTLMFSSTIVCTYLVGKILWSRETGFIAGLLLLGHPYLLIQVPLMLVDVPAMFFLMLSIMTFLRVLERGSGRDILSASVSIFLTMFSKYSLWLMLSILVIIIIVYMKKDRRQTLQRGGVVLLFAGILTTAFVLYKFDFFVSQISLLLSYQKPGLARWQESAVSTFFFQTHPLITAAAGYSVYGAAKARDRNYAIIAWLVLLVVVILQVGRIRYILPLFPMISLMASYGMQALPHHEIRKYLGYSTAIASLVIAVFAYLPFTLNTSAVNIKKAGEYLNSLEVGHVEVYTRPLRDPSVNPSVSVPILDLYTQKQIRYVYRSEDYFTPDDVATSSLRFTWEYRNPRYYTASVDEAARKAIIVISGDASPDSAWEREMLSPLFHSSQLFDLARDPFRYKTIVTVFADF